MMKAATPKEAVAVTWVFWDMKKFPVPLGFDARRVGPCIKQLLKRHGYCGPLTINAVGLLTDVHDDILRALSSTGINLYSSFFGNSEILCLMFKWIDNSSPPANIFVICGWNCFPGRMRGYNIFRPSCFSPRYSEGELQDRWINLILEESRALEEDTCSETGESGCWFCLICLDRDPVRHVGFNSWTGHLSSSQHASLVNDLANDVAILARKDPPTMVRKQPEMATPKEAVAVTLVFWDMKTFPVPISFDAPSVCRCIKRFLEKYGYTGPLTINAVGILSDFRDDILGALSSTGINLHSHGSTDIMSLMSECISRTPPPANILGICDPRCFPVPLSGYNIFRPFSYSSPQQDASLWQSYLLAGALEEDTCSETGEYASHLCSMRSRPLSESSTMRDSLIKNMQMRRATEMRSKAFIRDIIFLHFSKIKSCIKSTEVWACALKQI